MKITIDVDHTFTELLKLLFTKKTCPTCNIRLKRQRKTRTASGWSKETGEPGVLWFENKHIYRYHYRCPKCSKKIELSELGKK